jgi:hypothetical protein
VKKKQNIKLFYLVVIILLLFIIFVIAADLTPGVVIEPNSTIITLIFFNRNMTFDQQNFSFERIEVDPAEVRFSNDSSSDIIFNSTFSFNNLNITLVRWDLEQRNVTVRVEGASSPNFLYFNISRNDSSSCFINKTNVVNGYLNDYCVSRLEPTLVTPDTAATTNLIQNYTFIVNATVYCRDSDCGNVNGTVMYNLSSSYPNIPVNTTQGDKPFYIQETSPAAMKSCPANPLTKDEFCNLTWTINATGSIGTDWKIGVYFNSSYAEAKNTTLNASVSIITCTEDFTTVWDSVRFGLLTPSTDQHPAQGNSNNLYNITVNPGSCNIDLYIKGTYLENSTLNSRIGVGNITWSNTSNTYSSSYNLSGSNAPIKVDVERNNNVTMWYWINVPAVYSGYYNGTINITGVKNGQTP